MRIKGRVYLSDEARSLTNVRVVWVEEHVSAGVDVGRATTARVVQVSRTAATQTAGENRAGKSFPYLCMRQRKPPGVGPLWPGFGRYGRHGMWYVKSGYRVIPYRCDHNRGYARSTGALTQGRLPVGMKQRKPPGMGVPRAPESHGGRGGEGCVSGRERVWTASCVQSDTRL